MFSHKFPYLKKNLRNVAKFFVRTVLFMKNENMLFYMPKMEVSAQNYGVKTHLYLLIKKGTAKLFFAKYFFNYIEITALEKI